MFLLIHDLHYYMHLILIPTEMYVVANSAIVKGASPKQNFN